MDWSILPEGPSNLIYMNSCRGQKNERGRSGTTMRPNRLLCLAVISAALCFSVGGCRTKYTMNVVRVTLVTGSPTDRVSGLKLISVDSDGTAHVERPNLQKVYSLRPNGPQNQISLWSLESTDHVAQTATFTALLCEGEC